MAGRTVLRELVGHVVRVSRRIEVGGVAADAGVWRVHVVAVVAGGAVVGHHCVSTI